KRALQQDSRLPLRDDAPLLGLVSRLDGQKGIDLLLAALPDLLQDDLQVVILDSGRAHYEQRLAALAHCVSNGKILLAYLPDEQIERMIRAGLPRLTERTLTDPADLRAELATIRRRGYATADGEFEEGMNAVSAPLRDQRGEVIAAVTVSGPVYRLPRARLTQLARSVMAAAEELSRRLGYKEA
ncbi:MAG: glycosyltransferase, partial [Chloroflexi bacterium]|nr:glycosyltransferase [Chloroflexota bacterium]